MDEQDSAAAACGPAPIRVLIVEDHAALGEALLFAFGFEEGIDVLGVAPTIADAIERVGAEGPDVVLMDVRLPDGSGLDAAGRVKAARPGTAVVIMTAHADKDDALRAAEAGAAGFILKDVRIAKVVAGVRRAVAGEAAIDPTVLQSILNQAADEGRRSPDGHGGVGPASGSVPKLTPPERDLVGLLAGGAGRSALTEALGVGEAEVAAMSVSLQERLGARSILEALVRAARIGLLDDPDQGPRARISSR
jgi:DNA-binding NarL/FixJ family response regulator